MEKTFDNMKRGYKAFREKYATGDASVMRQLASKGQSPSIMVVSCCDSRVDPSVILQCDPGELFIARNVANIIPPFESDEHHHGTSAALEFAVCYLNIKHIIVLGHSDCGGINALINGETLEQDDFISNWVSLLGKPKGCCDVDEVAKSSLSCSHTNCMTFPWIKSRVDEGTLAIHQWFFDIKSGQILVYNAKENTYQPL